MKMKHVVAAGTVAAGAGALVVAGGAVWAASQLLARRYDLHGKVVLITGGSRGLGLALAREFGRRGARLAICARNGEELERARVELEGAGFEVFAAAADVTDRVSAEEMVRSARSRFGRIDVLVNNAGVIEVGPMDTMTLEDYEEAMKAHFWAPLYTSLAVLPQMKEARQGRIVNISSIGGKISVPHLVPYSASKFALTGLSHGMRAELAKDGIVVTTICPSLMRTGSPRNAYFKGKHRAEYAWFSISDAMPLIAMAAERAARRIVRACERGEAEVILSLQAKLVAKLYALFPGVGLSALGLVNRLLPASGGIGSERAKGSESQSAASPSFLTLLDERAARRHNQLAGSALS